MVASIHSEHEARRILSSEPGGDQPSAAVGVEFADLFDIEDIQRIQDDFSAATGVASIIVQPDGTPITRPSNFCRLCNDIIRETEQGRANCMKSDAVVGNSDESGPRIQTCLSGGLIDGGASISVGGKHVANWLIGQVRVGDHDEARMLAYAREIGADPEEFRVALAEVPVMPAERFERIARMLFSFANQLSLIAYQNVQQAEFITEQERVKSEIARLNGDLEQLAEQRGRDLEALSLTLTSVIDVVGQIVETRDPYTAGHQRRVAQLAYRIAEEMGLPFDDADEIRTAALIHDVGKISVPAEILSKPGALSAAEFEIIKDHAEAGFQIISAAHMQGQIAELVFQHHERCDGSGYPRGLKCEELLVGSRVLMVADVVEAMASHRPYRPALGIEPALAEVEKWAGVRYESSVVEACARLFRERGFVFSEVESIL